MIEQLNEALEELKRVDHLIYVSLKYTRTVDVILNVLNRMVDAYSLMVDSLIALAVEQKKMSAEPESAVQRAEVVKQMYGSDQTITDNMGLYLLLRKLLRARHVTRENEYRRHVTMKTVVDGREEIVTIDIITNYYLFQREFIAHVKGIVDGRIETGIERQSVSDVEHVQWDEEPMAQHRAQPEPTVVHTTPAKKHTIKIRPVGSPPRKRAPRPKKYKIQIPKNENSVTLSYEYDPHFRREMEKEKQRLRTEALKKEAAAKRPARTSSKKKAARSSSKKKVVKSSSKKKVAKKAARMSSKKVVKSSSKKKAARSSSKKKVVKSSSKKKVAKKTARSSSKKKVVKSSSKKKATNAKSASGVRKLLKRALGR